MVAPCLSESCGDLSSKMKHIVGNEVGEFTVLRVPPHMFRRIEFRGVWREPLDFESRAVSRLQGSHGTAVSAKPVDDEGDGPANLAQQPGDEQIEVLGREIVVEDVE